MPEPRRTIGFVFIDGYADWEYGMLAASARGWFGMSTVSLTPDGGPVRGIAGFTLTPDRGVKAQDNGDLDAVAVIGSDGWAGDAAPDIAALLAAVHERGGVVGGICAGTLALARARLFADRAHTSNGRVWLQDNAPGYAGQANYRDVAHAVADGPVISAPGSAPGTFALEFLGALLPEAGGQLRRMRAMFAKEYADIS